MSNTTRMPTVFKNIIPLILITALISGCAFSGPAISPDKVEATSTLSALAAAETPDPRTELSTPTARGSLTPTILPVFTLTPESAAALPNPEALQAILKDDTIWKILVKEVGSPEPLFALNPDEEFHPASMLKIALAMIVLDILDQQGQSLSDLASKGIGGRNFSALLEAMVIRSENEATATLEYFARGDNRLRVHLDNWGLKSTGFEPMRSTAADLASTLEGLYQENLLREPFRGYLLDLMMQFTENDTRYLGVLRESLPSCQFYNKRGELLNPTVVSDMGILACSRHTYVIVMSGTPAPDSSATFESILTNLEAFARELGDQLSMLNND